MGPFKLGKMTFGSLFKKPETVLYPVESKPQPTGLKGHISLEAETCILCGMCDRSCPTDCITVDKANKTWAINRFSCIQCGYCVTVCPKSCLVMEPGYAPAATEINDFVIEVPMQESAKKPKKAADEDAPAPSKKADGADAKEPDAALAKDGAPKKAAAEKRDDDLEAKIAIMDADKAEKVRAALARTAPTTTGDSSLTP